MSALDDVLNTAARVATAAHADQTEFMMVSWLNSPESAATSDVYWLMTHAASGPTRHLPPAVAAWSDEQRLFVARQVGAAARALVAAELRRP